MTQFTVDAAELNRMSSQAAQLANELDGGHLPRGALDGIAGSDQVQSAYDAFVGHWSDGLFFAQKHLHELSDRLNVAASSYLDTEQKIQTAAGSGSSSSATT